MSKQKNELSLIEIVKIPVTEYTVAQHEMIQTAAKQIAKLAKESTAYLKGKLEKGEKIAGVTYTPSRQVRTWKPDIKEILPKLVKAGLTDIIVKDRKKLSKALPDYHKRDDIFEFKVHSANKLEKDFDIDNLEKFIEKVPVGKSIKFVKDLF